jgi:putative transposase
MKFNPEIHHRRSIRLQGYDYSRAGLYFITICTQARKCLFGVIKDGKVVLNDAGKIANDCWLKIPEHFQPRHLIWQRNYYERIIHNEQSYKNISDYIMNNPSKWKTNIGMDVKLS